MIGASFVILQTLIFGGILEAAALRVGKSRVIHVLLEESCGSVFVVVDFLLISLKADSLLLFLSFSTVVFERESSLEGAEVKSWAFEQRVLLFAKPAFNDSKLVELVLATIQNLSINLVVFL
jgi:hypothetical protein